MNVEEIMLIKLTDIEFMWVSHPQNLDLKREKHNMGIFIITMAERYDTLSSKFQKSAVILAVI